jgi:hypothetical protein
MPKPTRSMPRPPVEVTGRVTSIEHGCSPRAARMTFSA